ncbi:class A beta-lactamase, subclass A2 [Sphingobacterium sp. MYb382]|uniref:class A beta-lactamase, subclass A2 n=1 Tax=Sphingobacterium sp. MYb382 TaxID=2745278 RepID=UPI00309BF240
MFRKKLLPLVAVVLCLSITHVNAQAKNDLREALKEVLADKNATVGIAISRVDGTDTLSIQGDGHFPMQSVFKFHIALVMLDAVDQGKFTLDQNIVIPKARMQNDLWSPIREEYPDGVELKLSEIIEYTVALSDNVGCDVLLELLGGPAQVEGYLHKKGFNDISIKINEETMQSAWDLQFQNWTTPKCAIQVLKAFYNNDNKLLSSASYDFLLTVMKGTQTGRQQLKGLLPEGTVVAHKTGNSGKNKKTGVTAALNDIGLVFPPQGQPYSISVFVSQSKEDTKINERIIAELSKLVWDYYTKNP